MPRPDPFFPRPQYSQLRLQNLKNKIFKQKKMNKLEKKKNK